MEVRFGAVRYQNESAIEPQKLDRIKQVAEDFQLPVTLLEADGVDIFISGQPNNQIKVQTRGERSDFYKVLPDTTAPQEILAIGVGYGMLAANEKQRFARERQRREDAARHSSLMSSFRHSSSRF
jgi:hypothetical protein